jgi:sentrin-specific protease 1
MAASTTEPVTVSNEQTTYANLFKMASTGLKPASAAAAITTGDIDTLRASNWLNDNIINFYMEMIVERSSATDNWPKVYCMNTFFLPKLSESGYDNIKKWTKNVDIFSYDVIIVPVHLGNHWCLAVINLKKKGVFFYDSMGSNNPSILKLLLYYLEQESLDKKKAPFNTSSFGMEIVKDIPKQTNSSDCGVFILKYTDYVSRNESITSITFTQEQMPFFRRKMVQEIAAAKEVFIFIFIFSYTK